MTMDFKGKATFEKLLGEVEAITGGTEERDGKLGAICLLLRENVPHYDWVGFYLTDPGTDRELVLGPYEGTLTNHTRIPFGRGICGQAADTKETFVVQDVSKEAYYLSCSIHVKSEIVVPILASGGRVLGELDIDSHQVAPFTDRDSAFLEKVCGMIAGLL